MLAGQKVSQRRLVMFGERSGGPVARQIARLLVLEGDGQLDAAVCEDFGGFGVGL